MRKINGNIFKAMPLLLFASALLAGCSIISTPPPLQIVVLHSYQAEAACPDPLDVQIVIPVPHASAGLNTDRIAILLDNRQVNYLEGYRWENSNVSIVQRQLVDAINSSNCFTGAGTGSMSLRADYRLELDVKLMHFTNTADNKRQAEVDMLLRLVEVKSGRLLGQYDARARELCGHDLFGGMEKALHLALRDSLGWLRETVSANQPGK